MTGPLELDQLAEREQAAHMVFSHRVPLTVAGLAENMLSMNDREHFQVTKPKKRYWRQLGAVIGRQAGKLDGGRVVVFFRLPKGGKGVRTVKEVANLQPVVKCLVDGLVDAGVFPDDDDLHVWGQDARRLPFTGACEAVVTIWA